MKWYKHISDSLDDPFIFELIDRFGGDGYLVFFGTLEVMSREFNIKSPGICTISHRFLSKKLQLSHHKLLKILNFCDKKGRILVSENGSSITLNCPKLEKMCDEWTKRQLKSGSVVPQKKHNTEEEVEEEVERTNTASSDADDFYITKRKRKLQGKRLETFNRFWECFNLKKGKAEAADAWLDIPILTEKLVNEICKAASNEAKVRQDIILKGQTPKWAQGWLSSKRWEDEFDIDNPEKQKLCPECKINPISANGLCKECNARTIG